MLLATRAACTLAVSFLLVTPRALEVVVVGGSTATLWNSARIDLVPLVGRDDRPIITVFMELVVIGH